MTRISGMTFWFWPEPHLTQGNSPQRLSPWCTDLRGAWYLWVMSVAEADAFHDFWVTKTEKTWNSIKIANMWPDLLKGSRSFWWHFFSGVMPLNCWKSVEIHIHRGSQPISKLRWALASYWKAFRTRCMWTMPPCVTRMNKSICRYPLVLYLWGNTTPEPRRL